MPASSPIDEVMIRWETARRRRQKLTVEELCAGCPHLTNEVRRRIRVILAMEGVLGVEEDDPDRTVLAPPRSVSAPSEEEPLPIIPGYEVLRVVDRGGMGVVYEARQVALGRTVAIKMIAVHLGPRVVARFRLEAEAAARLQHPNFVQIFEVGQVSARPFFSMEFVAGGSLADLLARQPLSHRQAAELTATLARAIHAAHECGIVHRDLKPSNVMLAFPQPPDSPHPHAASPHPHAASPHPHAASPHPPTPSPKEGEGEPDTSPKRKRGILLPPLPLVGEGGWGGEGGVIPKIADFGLAKRLDQEAGHTYTGEILGTPSYMAPEQAEGHNDQIGPATDVYALGAILYELLACRPPFQGDTPLASLRLIVAQEPIAPSRLVPSVPRDLEAICLKCLEKAPGQRYASARALAEDLQRFLSGQPVTARPSAWPRRTWKWARRHPQKAAWCLMAGVLALVATFFGLGQDRAQREVRLNAENQAPLVRAILQRHCLECHGRKPGRPKKNLNILDHQNLLDSARRIVVPGAPEDSRLIQRISDGSMPPEEEEVRLPRVSEEELVVLKEWILGGAPPFGPGESDLAEPATAPPSEWAAKAKALFHKRCYKCHRHDVAKGGIKILHHRLLVTVRKVVVPGHPEDSELFQLVRTADDETRMPPAPAKRLSPEEISTIRAWILEGALPFPRSE